MSGVAANSIYVGSGFDADERKRACASELVTLINAPVIIDSKVINLMLIVLDVVCGGV